MYLVKMNKVEMISEGHGKKYIYRNDRMFCCLILINIIHGRIVLESADKYKYNCKDKHKNILCKIFYVVSVCMYREILEYQHVLDNMGLMEITVTFCLFGL